MSVLQQLHSERIRSPGQLREPLHLTNKEVAHLNEIADRYPICILPYYLNLIGFDWKHDPIRRLCIPDPMESSTDGRKDTSGESDNTVVVGMQHKSALLAGDQTRREGDVKFTDVQGFSGAKQHPDGEVICDITDDAAHERGDDGPWHYH